MSGTGMKQKRNGGQEINGSCVKYVSFNYLCAQIQQIILIGSEVYIYIYTHMHVEVIYENKLAWFQLFLSQ